MSEQIGEVNRDEILDRLERELAGPAEISRETWGTSPAYVAEQRTIMSEYGPPAGWVEKVKQKG